MPVLAPSARPAAHRGTATATAVPAPAVPAPAPVRPGRAALRVAPVPRHDPPATRPEPVRPPQRTLRLGRTGTLDRAAEALAARAATLEPALAPLPDPTALCCSVVRAAVEVLRGERPVQQLTRWVSPAIYDQLVERTRLLRDAPGGRTPSSPVGVRRARLVRLGDGVAEATVVLEDEDRVRAAAVRLEARRGTWRVVVLELG